MTEKKYNPAMEEMVKNLIMNDPVLSMPDEEFKEHVLKDYTWKDRITDGVFEFFYNKWTIRVLKAVLAPVIFACFLGVIAFFIFLLTITFPTMGVDVYGTPHPVADIGFIKAFEIYGGYMRNYAIMGYTNLFGNLDAFQKTMAFVWLYILTTGITIFFWNNVERKGLARGLVFPILKLLFLFTVIGAVLMLITGISAVSRRRY